jgi:leucyl-tRNA synthetase
MEYDFKRIEQAWRKRWAEQGTYTTGETSDKPKYYVLDMFPYPSGAGLHVGHPLGYIASDIIARYMRHRGYNVLHPMGYDSFGLPAEQYAIQTGQHPAVTTERNIARYREQLDKLGFSYDWSREVRTSNPSYYRWTQWIFSLIYRSWYNLDTDRAEPVENLVDKFAENGNYNVNAVCEDGWWKEIRDEFFFGPDWEGDFSATDWLSMTKKQQELILMQYRLTYLADSVVNWCPALGTVLANDEIKDGVSERGGHPVVQKKMRQWSMRITAYAQRLLDGLDRIDWPENIKEVQRNWIGRSEGALVRFPIAGHAGHIEVFTTRPDTIFGVSFMTLAPEHPLVPRITTPERREAVEAYAKAAGLKTERDRQSEVKQVTGVFTGAYAVHPFTGEKIPVWIGDYVLAGYGTGAVMAVPAGDQRDWEFAKKFASEGLTIPNIFAHADTSAGAETSKEAVLCNSDFLNGLSYHAAFEKVVAEIEQRDIGLRRVNYRMRDAVFSRQRYWGEPFPVYYEDGMPYLLDENDGQVTLPEVDKYLPTEEGEPPLARARREAWNVWKGERMEYNTMPGWAGSSWYFLRYMDPHNDQAFASPEKLAYWNQVDLYMGGAEHATGHLLYARFWTKILHDRGYIAFDEPFKKMINQGMILGRSNHVYRIQGTNTFVTAEKKDQYDTQQLYVDINIVENDKLNLALFRQWMPEYANAEFMLNDDSTYTCTWAIDKMSKRWYNVANPDDLCEKFGADTLRMYEMFLGPVEQSKPWDTKGINGVHNFIRKLWRLCHDQDNRFMVDEETPTAAELKILHTAIKKVSEDLQRYSWNTVVSTLMICVNDLTDAKCNKRQVLEPLVVLLSPYAPHLAEELWQSLGHTASVTIAPWPEFNPACLEEDSFDYPVSFNGKTRFFIPLGTAMSQDEVSRAVLAHEQTARYLEGKTPKKIIVVPRRIVNVVV